MHDRTINYFSLCAALLFFLIVPYMVNAESISAYNLTSVRSKKDELLCMQIHDKIKRNQEIRKVVTTSIQMGYDACGVITCAIKGGANVKQVITGAIDAGTTKDIVSRCALDAGAEAREVAGILSGIAEPGVCYFLPEEPEIIALPPSGTREGFISPSGF